jgi:alkanesulfonate monooxygenase SsuD/methylene tetrahydromethanopterin reductase-like flavin-dependent oxidoreductase (luciferase family)
MSGTLGLQLAPWKRTNELVAVGETLRDVVDVVWVQDQMLARNVYVVLTALAQTGCGIGTNVTYPIGRNPIEMAAAIATVAELMADDARLEIGLGTGGALVSSLFDPGRAVDAVAEAIRLMRGLWRGDDVELDAFPTLGARLGYRDGAVAKLTFPVERQPSIVVAGVKPKIMRVAAELADGLICPSNLPTMSIGAFRSGRFGELSGLDAAIAARPRDLAPLRLLYGINVSVAPDGALARAYARRQIALVVGNPRLWPDLEAVGLDLESAAEVKAAFDAGLGVDGAADRVSDSLCEGLVVAGRPDEVGGRMAELRDLAAGYGFGDFYIGAPLGPDPLEAAKLLCDQVIGEVWPERMLRA